MSGVASGSVTRSASGSVSGTGTRARDALVAGSAGAKGRGV